MTFLCESIFSIIIMVGTARIKPIAPKIKFNKIDTKIILIWLILRVDLIILGSTT